MHEKLITTLLNKKNTDKTAPWVHFIRTHPQNPVKISFISYVNPRIFRNRAYKNQFSAILYAFFGKKHRNQLLIYEAAKLFTTRYVRLLLYSLTSKIS